jgi:hypothetical protein
MQKNSIIRKQVVSVTFNTAVQAPFAVQEAAMDWCREVLLPAIEEALAVYENSATIIRVDALLVEVQTDGVPFSNSIAGQIASELVRQIEAAQPATGKGVQKLSKEQSFEEAFLFFLGHGYMPWWCSMQHPKAFQQNCRLLADTLSDTGRRKLQQLLSGKTVARRMVMAVPDDLLVRLLAAIGQQDRGMHEHFLKTINALAKLIQNADLRRRFLLQVKTGYATGQGSEPTDADVIALKVLLEQKPKSRQQQATLTELFHSWVSDYQVPLDPLKKLLLTTFDFSLSEAHSRNLPDGQDSLKNPQPRPELPQRVEALRTREEGFYITDAGLILAAPFLPRFFANLGIVAEGRFNSKDLAIALMHWLVTGREGYAEFQTVLAKVLCGMEPEEPIIVIPQLPDGFKREATTLLAAIIGYWPALKNTSVEGLREAFLQREGKLSVQGNEWLLQVEQKAYDMLLNELPWTIHTVKLPWMERLVRTEWV